MSKSQLFITRSELERKVEERTAELQRLNDELRAEIAERKQAEDALRRKESYLAEAQRLSQTGSWVYDAVRGVSTYWSAEQYRICGFDPQAGPPSVEMDRAHHPPEEWSRLMETVGRAVRDKADFETDSWLEFPDGTIKYLRIIGHPVVNASGDVIELVGTTTDVTERTLAEETNRRLAWIVESTDDAVISRTPEGVITSWNKAAEKIFGFRAEEMIGRHISTIIPDDRADEVHGIIEAAQRGEALRVETVRLRKDGRRIDVALTVSAIRDAHDRIVGAAIIARDITERKGIEERQARAARHAVLRAEVSAAFNEGGPLRAILQSCAKSVVRHLDAALARIWTLDASGAVLELQASSGLYTHLDGGYARVLVGRYKIGLIAEERAPHLTNSVQEDERVEDKEWARREGLVSFAGYPLLVEGRLVGVVAMFARVALGQDTIEAFESIAPTVALCVERKQGEEKLRESERSLRLLTEAIPQLIWSATPDGAIDYCNRQLLEYTGKTLDEMRGDGWVDILHPEDVGQITESWRTAVKTGEPFEVECGLRRADGRFRWSISRGLPLRDGNGVIIRWYGTCTDMDDWKRAEGVLRETQGELAHLNRVMTVGELTSSIAHEINQPLAAIVMNGNACLRWLALDPPDVARARASAEAIIRDGDRASQVISRIRALLKKTPSAKSTLDVGELAREVIALTRHEVVSNKVNLKTNLETALPPVSGDRIQLQQVMINLTVNAVEAMRGAEGGRRELLIAAGKEEGGGVSVTVSDTGGGFDPQEAEHLFDAFYTTKSEGMGMGLAISRSIVEAHGGRLWAEPNESGGATFHFTLPGGERGVP